MKGSFFLSKLKPSAEHYNEILRHIEHPMKFDTGSRPEITIILKKQFPNFGDEEIEIRSHNLLRGWSGTTKDNVTYGLRKI